MSEREIPVYEPDGQYHSTKDRDLAMANGYIGEYPFYPNKIAYSVGLCFKRRYRPFVGFYYGTPDEHLKKLFGYE